MNNFKKKIGKKILDQFLLCSHSNISAGYVYKQQSWISFVEFGIVLVRLKLCVHAREEIALYSRKLCIYQNCFELSASVWLLEVSDLKVWRHVSGAMKLHKAVLFVQ